MLDSEVKSIANKTIQQEAEAVSGLKNYVNDDLIKALHALNNCKGRIVISGIGKSAIIAQKIVATLNSTGTASIFLHAADAIHGDIGMVQKEDIVLIISKSGDSPEIKVLVPLIKNFGNVLIAIVGNISSFLALHADIILNTTVAEEACPHNLAPTTSTTAQMVMGDVLAICLMEMKGFGSDDFAKFHPGGTLGKQLYLKVADLIKQNQKPEVHQNANLHDVIIEITSRRLGATVVVDDQKNIVGIITDGDLRRMLEKDIDLKSIAAKDIMSKTPHIINPDKLAIEALDQMRKSDISQLVVSENNQNRGIIHLHDLIREGII
ncbi:MAG: KpsF/GutQ family sugar-phosphate isomerase [Ginsengibacter sp.]